jgi:hypothetical protein
MKHILTIAAVLVSVSLLVLILVPHIARVRSYSGPGIYGNLRQIQLAKEQWIAAGNTNEWPSAEDLFPGSSSRGTLQKMLLSKYGELYFINSTGAPPFAYFPEAIRDFRAGEILVLASNGLMKVRQ